MMEDQLNEYETNTPPVIDIFLKCYSIFCTTVFTTGVLLICFFGGEFTYKVNFHTFVYFIKHLLK